MADHLQLAPETVRRDEMGFWTHPGFPESDDEYIPKTWFSDQGLEIRIVELENDAPDDMVSAYFESGDSGCSSWEPSKPAGEGWFVFSIHDTEDGPICVWVRPISA